MPTIEQSIEVSAPLSTVYNQWTQFEEFPKFMEGIERIEQTDETHMHWVANFGGKTHEWNATIVEQDPDQRVAWKSDDGKFNAGVATFHLAALIGAGMLAAAGVLGGVMLRNPRRPTEAEHCPGGQFVGAPEEVGRDAVVLEGTPA